MGNFHNLNEVLGTMPAAEPGLPKVKALALGEGLMAGLLRTEQAGVGLHRQPNHEELLLVLEGEAQFRVGDEVRHLRKGDLVFVPRDAVHGTVAAICEPVTYLAIVAPHIDLAKDLVWEGEPAAFAML